MTSAECKHCHLTIEKTEKSSSWKHAQGVQQGKFTCGVDPYGFHAEPVGSPCSDHPANPCNGSRGLTPRHFPHIRRIKVVIDVDPPDLEIERRLADEVGEYLSNKYQFNVTRLVDADIPDQEWRHHDAP